MKYWPTGVARVTEIVIGIAYLVAALLKALDFNAFLPQIYAYQVVTNNNGLMAIAFAALSLETGLGICMVLGTPWRRLVLGVSAVMLCFFSGLIVYAWQVHGLEDCGCLGKVKVTPTQAIGKNLILLIMNGVAYYGLVFRRAPSVVKWGGLRVGAAVGAAVLVCVAVIPQLGVKDSSSSQATPSGPFAEYVIESEFGDTFDLASGDYLVALLSMNCEHCMASVPQLNEFVFDNTLPPLVAICLEPEAGSMEEFRAITQPQFPMHSLGDKQLKFFPLLESAPSPPRLVYIRDGATVSSWEGTMPDYSTLRQALDAAGVEESAKVEPTE